MLQAAVAAWLQVRDLALLVVVLLLIVVLQLVMLLPGHGHRRRARLEPNSLRGVATLFDQVPPARGKRRAAAIVGAGA